MTEHKIADRYARALLNLSQEQNVEDGVHEDVLGIARAIAESPELQAFLRHPTLSLQQQRAGIETLFASRLFKLSYTFVQFVAARRRLSALPDICVAFEALHREAHNILQARITSAAPLSETQINTVRTKLAERHRKTIDLSTHVDGTLIGGFAIQVEDIVHDYSVNGKLNKLRRNMCHA
ncbi:MAG: ATP synthase F1 subunit delta [Verrucomicrobia bacterium]|nr:ATP synthase F1 subunit delta [Verrucomicrobiota bacterium]